MKRVRILGGIALLVYLLGLVYFGFRPFKPIPGWRYAKAAPEWAEDAVRVSKGAALEDPSGVSKVRKALRKTGRMSLEIVVQTDSLGQCGPARIITFSRDPMGRNFTLGQNGNALSFRLRTSETQYDGQYKSLLVPQVLNAGEPQHLVVSYDGAETRLYVDGILHPARLKLSGDFRGWGRNHTLVLGDEPMGGRPWNGRVWRFSIYDRALNADEVAGLYEGAAVAGAVWRRDFQSLEDRRALRQLRYRNLFVTTDSTAYELKDCIANIVGFVPLAALLYWAFPFRRRFFPLMVGLVVSGAFELAQQGVLGRVPSLLDLVYNGFGTLLGCTFLFAGLKWIHRMER